MQPDFVAIVFELRLLQVFCFLDDDQAWGCILYIHTLDKSNVGVYTRYLFMDIGEDWFSYGG